MIEARERQKETERERERWVYVCMSVFYCSYKLLFNFKQVLV